MCGMHADEAIIFHMRSDARRSLVSISYAEKLPVSTIFDRLSRLESNSIVRYTSLLNPALLRFGIHIFFIIRDPSRSLLDLEFVGINTIYGLDSKELFCVESFFRSHQECDVFRRMLRSRKACILKEYVVYESMFVESLLSEAKSL
jgi:DNA-binding Lrp family transcriptional regulator